VFVLTVGLLLSDDKSRQVLVAVFSLLKAHWQLSDAQLGSLVSITALMGRGLLARAWRSRNVLVEPAAATRGRCPVGQAGADRFVRWLIAVRCHAFVMHGQSHRHQNFYCSIKGTTYRDFDLKPINISRGGR
jgi:hypothetical protein